MHSGYPARADGSRSKLATISSAYEVLRAKPSALADLMYEMLGCALTVSEGAS